MAYPKEMKEIFTKVKKYCNGVKNKPTMKVGPQSVMVYQPYVFRAFGDNDFRGGFTDIVDCSNPDYWVWLHGRFLTVEQFKRQHIESMWTE